MKEVRLPRNAYPRFVTFSRDGSLWISESDGDAVARLHPDGELQQYWLPGTDNSPGDLEEAPDGAIWVAGFLTMFRIGLDGSIVRPPGLPESPGLNDPSALAAGSDGAMWFTSASTPPHLVRIGPGGAARAVRLPVKGFEVEASGLAEGPDGAFWLTLGANEPWEAPDAIARVTKGGRVRIWKLSGKRSHPQRIAAGPDGALWFTEEAGYRIGRIAQDGEIREFRLRPGIAPFDIAAAPDGALWFSTTRRVGRITTGGRIGTWPVPGAGRLAGIAVAGDGSVWVADSPANVVHHFQPPL
jgi:virginiamycin B lyase